MLRPEIMELKSSVKTLKRDAALRLSLDAEAQQSFDFLSEQLHGLRRAFSTLSDVFVEEVDSLRAEQKAQAQALRSARAEVRRLKGEAEARAAEGSAHAERLGGLEARGAARFCGVEAVWSHRPCEQARVERASGEVQALARDAGKASSIDWNNVKEAEDLPTIAEIDTAFRELILQACMLGHGRRLKEKGAKRTYKQHVLQLAIEDYLTEDGAGEPHLSLQPLVL